MLVFADGGNGQDFLKSHNEFYAELKPQSATGNATMFMCENFMCNMPTSSAEEVRKMLANET